MLNPTAALMLLLMLGIVVYCIVRVVESVRNDADRLVVKDEDERCG